MRKASSALLAVLVLGAAAAAPAGATNGMNMIGYSTRSTGMGGADVAVDSDASAVGGNPALISRLAPSSATIQATALLPQLSYRDLANDVDGEDQVFPMPLLGYVHQFADTPWTLGLGVYVQGDMGVDFQDVLTPGGTRDEMTSQVSFLRFNPIVAYKVNDAVNLGATLMFGYAQAEFSQFPDTPGGIKVRDLTSFGYAARVGGQVKVGEKVRLGAMYTTESAISLDGGTATLNFGPQGGKVKYDAELEDFTWPQELEVGVAYLPCPGLTVAADVKWINWSSTIDTPQLKVSNPPAGFPPTPFPNAQGAQAASDSAPFDMGWNDQLVFALGAEYALNARHTLRAGVNYAKSPVPDAQLNPLFPAIPETHLTLGYGLNLGKWLFDVAYEHAFEQTQTNPDANGAAPGEPEVEIAHSQNTFSLAVSYRY